MGDHNERARKLCEDCGISSQYVQQAVQALEALEAHYRAHAPNEKIYLPDDGKPVLRATYIIDHWSYKDGTERTEVRHEVYHDGKLIQPAKDTTKWVLDAGVERLHGEEMEMEPLDDDEAEDEKQ